MVDGEAGEGDQAPGADTAGDEIGGPGVLIGFGQETAKDAHPFAVADMELVGGGESDGIDQGVDPAQAIEVALLEGPGSRLWSTGSDGPRMSALLGLVGSTGRAHTCVRLGQERS